MRSSLLLPFFAAVLMVSCTTAPKPSVSSTGHKSGGSPVSSSNPRPAPSIDQIPEALKNDAYHYYALGSSAPKSYKVSYSHNTALDSTLETSITLSAIGSKKIAFVESDSGTAATVQDMSLDDSGIYVDSTKPQVLKSPHFLELPATLKPGQQWKSRQWVDFGSKDLDETLTYKVLGEKKISTPAGSFEALDIIGTGDGKFGTTPAHVKVESWYVKDLGLIKQSATISGKGINSSVDQVLQK